MLCIYQYFVLYNCYIVVCRLNLYTIYISTVLLMAIGLFPVWATMNEVATNILIHIFSWTYTLISLGIAVSQSRHMFRNMFS